MKNNPSWSYSGTDFKEIKQNICSFTLLYVQCKATLNFIFDVLLGKRHVAEDIAEHKEMKLSMNHIPTL